MLEFVYIVYREVKWEGRDVISIFKHERDALLMCVDRRKKKSGECRDVSYVVEKERVLNEYHSD